MSGLYRSENILRKEVAVKFAYALSEKKNDPTPLCSRKLSRVGSINRDQIVATREDCLLENFEILHTYITLNYDGVHGVTFKSKIGWVRHYI